MESYSLPISEATRDGLWAHAKDVAIQATQLAAKRASEGKNVLAQTKSSPVDPVTQVDREVESLIRQKLTYIYICQRDIHIQRIADNTAINQSRPIINIG